MDLMLRYTNGATSFLSEKRGDQGNEGKEQVKAKMGEKGSLSNGKLRLTSRERANTLLVVATLVITVTFTASFTPPDGYNQETGIPTLISNPAFKVFSVCNYFAFIFAVESALTLILGMNFRKLAEITLYFGGGFIFFGLVFMSVAFMVGSFAAQQATQPRNVDIAWWIATIIILVLHLPAIPFLVFSCRKFKRLSEIYVGFALIFCSEQSADLDFTI